MMKIGIILLLISLLITTITHTSLIKADLSGVQKKEYEPEIFGNIWSKRLEIYSDDGKEYTYVFVLVSVPEDIDNIELYKRFSDGTQQRISTNEDYSFKKLDRDDNGKVDYVSWVVPKIRRNVFVVEGKIGNGNEVLVRVSTTTSTTTTSPASITTTIITTTSSETSTLTNIEILDDINVVVEGLPDGKIDQKTLGLVQGKAEIDKPVKWEKIISVENQEENEVNKKVEFELPKGSSNIEIKKEVKLLANIKWKKKIDHEINQSLDGENKIKVEFSEDFKPSEEKEYIVNFETPAPRKIEISVKEENGKWKKELKVVSDASIHYKDVLSYTDIKESEENQIHLYWLVDGKKTDVGNDPRFDVKFIDSNSNGLIDRLEWIVFELSEQNFLVEIDITIINVQSYPKLYGNWTVRFTTEGTANLTITDMNGTEFGRDIEFIELRCGDSILTTELTDDVVFVENYSCNETGYEISKVLIAGKHTLEFRFGDDVEYAYNSPETIQQDCSACSAVNDGSPASCTCTEVGADDGDYAVQDYGIATRKSNPAQVTTEHVDEDIPSGATGISATIYMIWYVEDTADSCLIEVYEYDASTWRSVSTTCQGTESLYSYEVSSYINTETDAENAQVRVTYTRTASNSKNLFVNQVYMNVSFTAVDETKPIWQDIFENTVDPAIYSSSPNYGFQVNCTDETQIYNVLFEHNVTGSLANITCSNDTVDIFYANITSMAVGMLNYSFICNDTSGNQNRSDYFVFTVSKGTSNISLFINDTEGDTNIVNNTGMNISVVNNVTGTTVYMTTNRTDWSQSSNPTPYKNTSELMYASKYGVKINVTGWWNGNENYTSDSQTYYINITELSACSVALALSDPLSDGVTFGNIGQGTNNDAVGNNGNLVTDYYVTVSISGCTPNTMNVSIKANDDLKNGTALITLSNEKFRNSTSDNTVDTSLQNISLTTNFADNQIGSLLNDNDKIYLKYVLTVPSSQKAGLYNNTIQIWGGRSDISPP